MNWPRVRRAIEHVDRAGIFYPPDVLNRDPNCQVFKAIAVEVAGGQSGTKVVALFPLLGNAEAVLMPKLVAGGRQATGTAIDHVDRADICVLPRDPNGQVFKAIVVEVTGGQRLTKVVARSGLPSNADAVLVPSPVAGGRQAAAGAAINHVDRADICVLPRDPNGQVFKAIVVEVTGGQRFTKAVVRFGLPVNAEAVLVPNLVAGGRQAAGAAINHVDRSGIFYPPDVLLRDPNGQVCKAIVVEVSGRQRVTKEVARFGPPPAIPGRSWCQIWLPGAARPAGPP